MNGLSLKMKITLWHAIFLILLYVFSAGFAFYVINKTLHRAAESRLKVAVASSSYEMSGQGGKLIFDEKFIYNEDGIYISAYSSDEELLFGKVLEDVDYSIRFNSDNLSFVKNGENGWYIYDILVNVKDYGDVWVRGVASMGEQEEYLRDWLNIAMMLLPLVFLLALAGGYIITKRGLLPIAQIANTAGNISNGRDLSRRIAIGEGSDEVHVLADTFNEMFDRLQIAFEKEQQFTADVSHELRTPLTVINSQCEYALDNDLTENEQRAVIASVAGQGAKMTELVRQLLALVRADKLQHTMSSENINFSELVAAIIIEQRNIAAKKNISIKAELEPDIIVRGDETMLIRLLVNLLSNAINYGKMGGLVKVKLSQQEDKAVCQVIDNGLGISEEDLKKIWHRFYQVDKSRNKKNNSGLGIGLAMAQAIVEAHGGQIQAESVLHEGSTFTFTLPCAGKN